MLRGRRPRASFCCRTAPTSCCASTSIRRGASTLGSCRCQVRTRRQRGTGKSEQCKDAGVPTADRELLQSHGVGAVVGRAVAAGELHRRDGRGDGDGVDGHRWTSCGVGEFIADVEAKMARVFYIYSTVKAAVATRLARVSRQSCAITSTRTSRCRWTSLPTICSSSRRSCSR